MRVRVRVHVRVQAGGDRHKHMHRQLQRTPCALERPSMQQDGGEDGLGVIRLWCERPR